PGSLRTHSLFLQLAQRARHLHHRRRATGGIDAAEYPGVTMIAEHDPFLGQLRTANSAFDDVVRLDGIVHLDLEMDARLLTAEVVLEGQTALPVRRGDGAAEIFEQVRSVFVRKRKRHYLWSRHGLLQRNTLRSRNRRPARGERIARNQEVVSDRSPLDVALRT